MFSGGYFGELCTMALKQASAEGVFSPKTMENINNLSARSTEEVNKFISGTLPEKDALAAAFMTEADKASAVTIIRGLTERAAKLVAANLAAVILKTGKAKTPEKPVLMTIEGTTFYKLHHFREMFEAFLSAFLSGENKRYYEMVEVENSSLVGAAIAALVN